MHDKALREFNKLLEKDKLNDSEQKVRFLLSFTLISLLHCHSETIRLDDIISLLFDKSRPSQAFTAVVCECTRTKCKETVHSRGRIYSSTSKKILACNTVLFAHIDYFQFADIYTYNAMLSLYAKRGMTAAADQLFQNMKMRGPKPDTVSYNTLIQVSGHEVDKKKKSCSLFCLSALFPLSLFLERLYLLFLFFACLYFVFVYFFFPFILRLSCFEADYYFLDRHSIRQ